jgi:hypothetical protein
LCATVVIASLEDIGVENRVGTLKEFCNPKYTKDVTITPIPLKIIILLSILY